jgi:NADH dehydrogenase/NADH:ubiquinone oxidoreductase subunit G
VIALNVDGIEIETRKGKTLLEACLENGIYIPNLCFLEAMEEPPASCRLCFVEIEGERGPDDFPADSRRVSPASRNMRAST